MATALLTPDVLGYRFDSAANLADAATRKRLSATAFKAFLRILEKWEVKDADARALLGSVSSGSFYQMKKAFGARALSQDELTRISSLIGIYKALNILYSPKLANAWMTLPNSNPIFAGATPLSYILRLGQPGMMNLRNLLDARRGGR